MHERPYRPIRIGQTECDPSRSVSARTFVTRVAFTQAATLSRASAGKFLAKWTISSLSCSRFQG